ncbi:MAG: aminotransferase class I/II-fold pyridoxal phosphate-dependent enzyme [Polyangiaceae bacterium]
MPSLATRTLGFTESVIRRMTRVALEHGAINLSQGFPDFDPPKALLDAAQEALRGPYHQYAITWGAQNFREALARKLTSALGYDVDPQRNLVVTCGSTEAMLASLLSLVNPGDPVVVFSPFYENYGADTILSGARPIYVELSPLDYGFDVVELRRAFAQGAKAIIVCNPSNPTGKVFSREELESILGLAREYDAFVITDEVYEHIVYGPAKHVYAASLPEAREHVVMCSSLSKTYSITGWRLGYVMAAPRVIDAIRKVHDFVTVGAAAPLQQAAVTALEFPPSYYDELLEAYAQKRELLLSYLEKTGLSYSIPQGAYYVLLDVSPLGFGRDIECAEWMASEIGVATVPGSSFFARDEQRYVRLHFAKREETLHEAGKRLLALSR